MPVNKQIRMSKCLRGHSQPGRARAVETQEKVRGPEKAGGQAWEGNVLVGGASSPLLALHLLPDLLATQPPRDPPTPSFLVLLIGSHFNYHLSRHFLKSPVLLHITFKVEIAPPFLLGSVSLCIFPGSTTRVI